MLPIDAHCHLPALAGPPPRAVGGVVLAGVHPSQLPDQHATVTRLHTHGLLAATTVGLHPWEALATPAAVETALDAIQAAVPHPSIVGIGETGLDRARGPLHLQVPAFEAQLSIAQDALLPVVLHVVRAHHEAIAVLRRVGIPRAGIQVHGFSGSADLVRAWTALGAFLSVGGPATWRLSDKRRAGIRAIPDHLLLVETDAPDQPVASARTAGLPGHPDHLGEVIAAIAHIRDQSPAHIARCTANNARRLFGLDMARPTLA